MTEMSCDLQVRSAPNRSLLDALFVLRALEDVLHENAWRDDVIGIDRDLARPDARLRQW